jgi:hypothetical protein
VFFIGQGFEIIKKLKISSSKFNVSDEMNYFTTVNKCLRAIKNFFIAVLMHMFNVRRLNKHSLQKM